MVIDYGKLIFGDVDSSDYGIYISGEGVYDAPERAVEFIDVPGRNGSIAMDQGRFENIKITYPAMVLEEDQETFREKVMAFRNAIMSQEGYQRLEDSYHPDEYRMGVYHAGLSVSDLFILHQGGNFELTFNCKPQRWLTAGELPTPVESGDVLQNPTPFDASPLLEVEGYGAIEFNGYAIELENVVLGDTELVSAFELEESFGAQSSSMTIDLPRFLNESLFETGDTISLDDTNFYFFMTASGYSNYGTSDSGDSEGWGTPTWRIATENVGIWIKFSGVTFTAGTSETKTFTYQVDFLNTGSYTHKLTATIQYVASGSAHIIHYILTAETVSGEYPTVWIIEGGTINVDSTMSALGNPTYIDCDLGEAYLINNGDYVSLNSIVDLGSDLPVLAPGSNTITFDNMITDLKIVPRWWRV